MDFLAIDAGNTLQKAAVFSYEGEMIAFAESPHIDKEILISYFEKYSIGRAIVSNVGTDITEIESFLHDRVPIFTFSHQTRLPIVLKYKTPQTLGLDQIANAVAANAMFPNENVLSIQAGTCLVMDFVNKDAEYLGGSISPGLQMRFKALHQFTERLPLIESTTSCNLVGTTTAESIRCGVINGLTDEINGAIQRYTETYGDVKVVLTGGNKNDLDESIKFPIFAAPNFVLHGLYKILIHNVETHI